MRLENGETIPYDVASLNLGSLPDFSGAPGASEHAIGVKPFEPFIARWNELMGKLSAQGAREPRIGIAGAGAAGVELAMAMMFALNQQGRRAKVVVFSDKDSFTPDVSARVRRALTRLSIELRGNTPASAVEPGPVLVSAAGREPFDAVFWAAGAAALHWLSESGLKTDPAGFVQIDAALRSVTHPEVFAAGDCASLERNPLPKSGVYAVRQGPVLAANLKRAILGKALERYEPQAKTLYLISCGGKYAIANRGNWSAEGRWAWTWKNWIDRRWIARFS
ncbi:MAG TPA: FAD-dependent oxidoreductase [Burkholderiales bacterium]|nr:FAD-dependent oxidoreductase [Burkholderiales bacterium]